MGPALLVYDVTRQSSETVSSLLALLRSRFIGQDKEPEMPKGKDAVDLGRAGFRQVGKSSVLLASTAIRI